jgi:hypothetical protein
MKMRYQRHRLYQPTYRLTRLTLPCLAVPCLASLSVSSHLDIAMPPLIPIFVTTPSPCSIADGDLLRLFSTPSRRPGQSNCQSLSLHPRHPANNPHTYTGVNSHSPSSPPTSAHTLDALCSISCSRRLFVCCSRPVPSLDQRPLSPASPCACSIYSHLRDLKTSPPAPISFS